MRRIDCDELIGHQSNETETGSKGKKAKLGVILEMIANSYV